MAPSERTRARTRSSASAALPPKARRTTQNKKKKQKEKKKKKEVQKASSSSTITTSSDDFSKNNNNINDHHLDSSSSSSGCSTPKAERYRIPEIVTCPPAPKKQRVVSNCSSLQRTPIAFFAPPDLELFFFFALRDISV